MRWSFRTQLILAFLLFSLVPTLLMTLVMFEATEQLKDRGLARHLSERPGGGEGPREFPPGGRGAGEDPGRRPGQVPKPVNELFDRIIQEVQIPTHATRPDPGPTWTIVVDPLESRGPESFVAGERLPSTYAELIHGPLRTRVGRRRQGATPYFEIDDGTTGHRRSSASRRSSFETGRTGPRPPTRSWSSCREQDVFRAIYLIRYKNLAVFAGCLVATAVGRDWLGSRFVRPWPWPPRRPASSSGGTSSRPPLPEGRRAGQAPRTRSTRWSSRLSGRHPRDPRGDGLGLDGQQRAQRQRPAALAGGDRAGRHAPGDRLEPPVGRRLGPAQRPARQGDGQDRQRGQRPGRGGRRGRAGDRRRDAADRPEDHGRRGHRLPDQPAGPERRDRGGPGGHAGQGVRRRRRRGPQARRAEPGRRAPDRRAGRVERRGGRERRAAARADRADDPRHLEPRPGDRRRLAGADGGDPRDQRRRQPARRGRPAERRGERRAGLDRRVAWPRSPRSWKGLVGFFQHRAARRPDRRTPARPAPAAAPPRPPPPARPAAALAPTRPTPRAPPRNRGTSTAMPPAAERPAGRRRHRGRTSTTTTTSSGSDTDATVDPADRERSDRPMAARWTR